MIKQRIPRPGRGRSGGFRSIILYRHEDRAFFVYGFSKSERENITEKELRAFKKLAKDVLGYKTDELRMALEEKNLER